MAFSKSPRFLTVAMLLLASAAYGDFDCRGLFSTQTENQPSTRLYEFPAPTKPLHIAAYRPDAPIENNMGGVTAIDPAQIHWSIRNGQVTRDNENHFTVRAPKYALFAIPLIAAVNLDLQRSLDPLTDSGFGLGGTDNFATHLSLKLKGNVGKNWTISFSKINSQKNISQRFHFTFKTTGAEQSLYIPLSLFEVAETPLKTPPNLTGFNKANAAKAIPVEEINARSAPYLSTSQLSESHSQLGILSFTLDPKLNSESVRGSALTIQDSIIYERDLRSPELLDSLTGLYLNYDSFKAVWPWSLGPNKMPRTYSPEKPGARRKMRDLLERIVESYYDPVHIQRTLDVQKMGDSAIHESLNRAGVKSIVQSQQLASSPFFFYSAGEIITAQPAIPIETGLFGEEHFDRAHADQVFTILQGLNAADSQLFLKLLSGCFGARKDGWTLWDILFDAPGNRLPNSPRFWRDQMANRK
jgi:hypothetical protein